MRKVIAILLVLISITFIFTACVSNPWEPMVENLMRGETDRANRQYKRIEKNSVQLIKTADYVYEYIENLYLLYEKEQASYESVSRRIGLFKEFDMKLYNLAQVEEKIEILHQSRLSFEEGKELFKNEKFLEAIEKFKKVIKEDTKTYDLAQEYLLSITHYYLYTEDYNQAANAILNVEINEKTLEKLSEYTVELIVRLLYYKDDIDKVMTLHEKLLEKLVLLNSNVGEALKIWAEEFKTKYSRPQYSAICVSFLSKDVADTFYKLDQVDSWLKAKSADNALIILKSIEAGGETIGYIAPRLTDIVTLYLTQNKQDLAQEAVDAIFGNIDEKDIAASLVVYVEKHIENEEYLNQIDLTIK